jgi:hypothetical protein
VFPSFQCFKGKGVVEMIGEWIIDYVDFRVGKQSVIAAVKMLDVVICSYRPGVFRIACCQGMHNAIV